MGIAKDLLPIGPNDRTIVIDEDNSVLFTDFPPRKATPEAGAHSRKVRSNEKPHLLDILDGKDQDILRVVGLAFDRPGKTIETDTTFRTERVHVLVLHVAGPPSRTQIIFQPPQ